MIAATDRHELSDSDVWAFILAGCNANEVAAFAGIAVSAAHALMARATRSFATAVSV